MLRKPRSRCLSLLRPIAFSPFARFTAQVAGVYMRKHLVTDLELQKLSLSEPSAAGTSGHSPEATKETGHADFVFFDPKSDDFHGAKTLLQNYLDDQQWDLSGFVDLILAQTTVGTMVKVEDDEDDTIFAFVTDQKCISQLKDYLKKVCKENLLVTKLKVLLEDHAENVGILVSQRTTNLPLQLLPHLYGGLFDEISWATEDEPTAEARRSFQLGYYLIISTIYKLNIFLCLLSVLYISVSDANIAVENYQLLGLVMVVDAKKAQTFLQQLKALVDD
ncbi:BCCIP-like protein [Drosera capensis]